MWETCDKCGCSVWVEEDEEWALWYCKECYDALGNDIDEDDIDDGE